MDVSVSLPLDNDGFLRRECPHCMQEFKWHHGPANEEAEQAPPAEVYHCPFCGQPAGVDSWWTQEQLEYIQTAAMPSAIQSLEDELDGIFRSTTRKHLSIKRTGHLDSPESPMPLVEKDDMSIVTSPCHPYEPVKIPETAVSPFYCLICGSPFAL
jgi:hypothetical protein